MISAFRGGLLGKRSVTFFRVGGVTGGGCSFYVRNKLKCERFNDKKSL